MMKKRMKVCICACTFQRPRELRRLLEGICGLSFRKVTEPDIEIVLVSNEHSLSSAKICEEFQVKMPWKIQYEIEPERGLSYARNKSIESASDVSDFIAFIDDDEVPDAYWLDELLYAQNEFNADVIYGKIFSRFDGVPPKWLSGKELVACATFKTGESIPYASTGNALIKASLVKKYKFAFDNKYAFRGGEDLNFFLRIKMEGFNIFFVREAIVYHWLPASRISRRWLIRRYFNYGIIDIQANPYICEKRSLRHVFFYLIGIPKWIIYGFFVAIRSLVMHRPDFVEGCAYVALGVGRIAGFLGVKYEPYRKKDS